MTPDHYPFMGAFPPAPAMPPARTFVKRGFFMCCTVCSLAVEYCNCGSQPAVDAGSQDGSAESSLEKRVREHKGKP